MTPRQSLDFALRRLDKKWRRCLSFIFTSIVFSPLLHNDALAESLEAGSDIWSPFFMESRGKYSGIGYDIITEVAKRTGDHINIYKLPNKRARTMFETQDIDLIVIDSPYWNEPEQWKTMVFTDEVMSVQEYIYFKKSHYIDVKSPQDLAGKTVNILRGYYYPVFEDAFNDRIVLKNELDSESGLIGTLIKDRTAAIFMDSIAFDYTIAKLKHDHSTFRRGMQLSDTSLGIKIQKDKAYLLPRFNQAIKNMQQEGVIEKIIRKYTKR